MLALVLVLFSDCLHSAGVGSFSHLFLPMTARRVFLLLGGCSLGCTRVVLCWCCCLGLLRGRLLFVFLPFPTRGLVVCRAHCRSRIGLCGGGRRFVLGTMLQHCWIPGFSLGMSKPPLVLSVGVLLGGYAFFCVVFVWVWGKPRPVGVGGGFCQKESK